MFEFGRLEPLYRDAISVKQKERVEKYGEVFTPTNIVNDMLDLIPEPETIERTYLEPACGDGNFLVEILNRKMYLCKSFHDVLVALSSIYAIDIQADNVLEARRRMLGVVLSWFEGQELTDAQLSSLNEILYKNIVLGNMPDDKMLKMDNDGYLLDFNKNTQLMLVASDKGRFDTYELLSNSNVNYSSADITAWYSLNEQSIDSTNCNSLLHYLNYNRSFNRLAFYNWTVTDETIQGVAEFLYDNEEEPEVQEPVEIKMPLSSDFFKNITFD